MANIQAALNSMLSSAQAGAFIYSQTPEYKKQAEIKGLEKQAAELEKEDVIQQELTDVDYPAEGTDTEKAKWTNEQISVFERSKELAGEQYKNYLALYKKTGDKQYYDMALKYTPSRREVYDEVIEELRKPDAKAVQEQEEKAAQQRAQKEALEIRRRILEGTVPADRFTELMKEER